MEEEEKQEGIAKRENEKIQITVKRSGTVQGVSISDRNRDSAS